MLFFLILLRYNAIFHYICTITQIIADMRIKEVIKEKGLTVGIVAKRMGVVQPALSRVINGNPTVEMVERVAAAIGVPASELFEQPTKNTITCPYCGKTITIKTE